MHAQCTPAGPTDTTSAVLDLLKEYGAQATFFNIARQAHNPLAERVLAEGHVIGGHTYSHVELTELTEAEVLNDTLLASAAIGKLLGTEPKYMRPPFGRFSWSTPLALEKIGTKIIIWSGGVWPEEPGAVVRNVRGTLRSGRSAIFMFHGEKDSDGAEHADMSTLRGILDARISTPLVALHSHVTMFRGKHTIFVLGSAVTSMFRGKHTIFVLGSAVTSMSHAPRHAACTIGMPAHRVRTAWQPNHRPCSLASPAFCTSWWVGRSPRRRRQKR